MQMDMLFIVKNRLEPYFTDNTRKLNHLYELITKKNITAICE